MASLSLTAVSAWRPHAPLQRLSFDWLAGVELAVLRLDLIDPLISGNKWFKLRPHLHAAARQGARGIISLGGAHSNHLHALAAAGQRFSFATVGLLRGQPQSTPTVVDLQRFGMQLHWLGYGGYRDRHRADFWLDWHARYPGFCAVPEGGGGLPGAMGCAQLPALVAAQLPALGWPDYHGWWLAAGTGTTLAGLVIGEGAQRVVHGALAVPRDHGVPAQVQALLAQAGMADAGYRLFAACRGGFARQDADLLDFMAQCEAQSGLPLEPLYTAKALMSLREAIEGGEIEAGTRLIFVHTGGLQGRRAALIPAP
ncbi:1-aminocyclopropane-1-carboxylate deaminase [Pseudomonas sp. BIGb0408]|uniref:1-aminocyclopropane-1-carboxylate deaminase n=1 Tax=Phytopseudomonas flavescens TaxID=29435 RepID=A0A7Z0BPI6_9GAMM|nr:MULTISPECIES: pyridoxal-phosphate dependent enzyme [Pseudomonas]MCW2293286.1 1-aminocyclopropane-1-carboxylate deaminase [Pseudomonas sp. BIGb0408]NYH72143.1 1-aminocyclopropane-1-carboxylate deaminase [Pseudomonas flavescens]